MQNKAWTTKDVKLLKELAGDLHVDCISQVLGRTPRAIAFVASREGIKTLRHRQKKRYYAEDVADIMEKLASNKTSLEVAKEDGTSSMSINSLVARAKKQGFDGYPKRK